MFTLGSLYGRLRKQTMGSACLHARRCAAARRSLSTMGLVFHCGVPAKVE